ncbi:MAG: M20/M25/M40 family metallo-hydrolase, partial [Brevundimonas sp.]
MSLIKPILSAGVSLALLAGPVTAQDAEAIRTAEALRDRALQGSGAYEIVEDLTTRFGARPAGTASEQAAARWGADQFRAWGFSNVAVESFPLSAWRRGEERVEVLSPAPQRLVVTALGGSVATPEGGVEGEAAIFRTYQELLDAPEGSLRGKIAVVLQDTPRAQDGAGYGSTSLIRFQGPTEAARRGAVGFLLRSLGTHDHRFAHTGATRVGEGTIPAFAVSPPDADQLLRLRDAGLGTVRLRLFADVGFLETSTSQNVIGEVVGDERPEEVIVIGGHLDSWDLGTGAIDDGAGVAITAAALKLIADLPERPARTIRVVWWGAEEVSQPPPLPGLAGARHYAETRRGQAANHVAVSESDFGAGPIYALALPANADAEFRQAAMRVLTPLGVYFDGTPARGGASSGV